MDIKSFFALAAGAVGIWAFFPYVKDVFQKRTHPHTFTWFIWMITQGAATTILLQNGGGKGGAYLMVALFFVVLIFILSLFDGDTDITKSDWLVLGTALVAIIVWQFMENPLLATCILAAIDVWGYVPTFRKSYMRPWTETLSSWFLFTSGCIFGLLALETYSLLTVTYLAALATINSTLVIFLVWRRAVLRQPAG